MHKLVQFIRSVYVVVLFVALEAVAFSYYARATSYTEARLLTRSTTVVGGVHNLFAGVRSYFGLRSDNRILLERVARLEERLAAYEEAGAAARLEEYQTLIGASQYRVMTARVVSNSVSRMKNMLTLNRGRRDGVVEDMAVLTPDGAMVGYVVDCTDRYAVAISVLNTSFRASGKIAGADYFGSVYWDGVDPEEVLLGELSKYADPQPGQEILTAGFSQFFPPDVPVGTVVDAHLNPAGTSYTVRVKLAARISRLSDVLLVDNRDREQILDLQHSEAVEQHNRR